MITESLLRSFVAFAIVFVTPVGAQAVAKIKVRYRVLATDRSVTGLQSNQTCAYVQKEVKKGKGTFKQKGGPKWGGAKIKSNGSVAASVASQSGKLSKLCKQAKGTEVPVVIDTSLLAPGKILFAAHNSQDQDADLGLFVVNSDGTDLRALADSGAFGAPDIEATSSGSWKIAYGEQQISIFDSQQLSEIAISDVSGATRADFSPLAESVTFQGGADQQGAGINIWRASSDGSSVMQLTNVATGVNAEWPYFSPGGTGILYFQSTQDANPRHFMTTDGSNDTVLPSPGGQTISHAGFSPDGAEFVDAQTLTSYRIDTGALGQLDTLKINTTILNQLELLGFEEVPASEIAGQGGRGTFALSADWSRDGKQIVFDALVKASGTDEIKGIAIFVYTLAEDRLTLVFGPEPFNGSRTNNHNYSVYTPKWVP